MGGEEKYLVVWDVDGTLLPADLRWLRRAVARTYALAEDDVVFPPARVHGYTDESIVVDTAVCSGVARAAAGTGLARFRAVLEQVMDEGREELAREQPAYPGAARTLHALHENGYEQTVLTGNLRRAAEVKLGVTGLDTYLDLDLGAFGSDARDRLSLPAVLAERYRARHGRRPDPARTVLIGDTPHDVACARRAGFRCVAVARGTGHEELLEHGPDALVEGLEPEHVVEVVGGLVGRRAGR